MFLPSSGRIRAGVYPTVCGTEHMISEKSAQIVVASLLNVWRQDTQRTKGEAPVYSLCVIRESRTSCQCPSDYIPAQLGWIATSDVSCPSDYIKAKEKEVQYALSIVSSDPTKTCTIIPLSKWLASLSMEII